jgi:hypothetical protein
MSRQAAEDAILALLSAGLAATVKVGSMPLGLDEDKALAFQDAAVWVVYAGAQSGLNTMLGAHVQPEKWTWAVYPLAKRYRATLDRKQAALELFEDVLGILTGATILDAPLTKGRDQIAPVAPGKGVFGYEILFTLDQEIRRTS